MKPDSGPGASRRAAANAARALGFLALFVVGIIVAGALVAPVLVWVIARTGQRLRVDFFATAFAGLAATVVMLRMVDHRDWSAVGLARAQASPRKVLAGFTAGTAAIGSACGLLLLTGWLTFQPFGAMGAGTSWGAAALRVTILLVPAALAEELLCRGYLLTVVRDSLGTWGAVGITSVAFGLLHLQNPGATFESVIVVMLAGVLLATVRVATDSLYAAWAAHLAWNWVMAVPLHAAVSGQWFETPGYRAVAGGPTWLSGGTWGPEGGLVSALGMVMVLFYFHMRQRREES